MPPAKRTYTQSSEPGVTLVACDHCHALFLPRGVKSHQIYCFHGPEKVRRRRGDTAAKVAEAQMKHYRKTIRRRVREMLKQAASASVAQVQQSAVVLHSTLEWQALESHGLDRSG